MRAGWLSGALLGALFGVVVAVGVQAWLGMQAFWPGLGRGLGAVLLSGACGALVGWVSALAARADEGTPSWRRPLTGSVVAAASAALLVHAPLPWTSLSVFGAGPAGTLTLVVLPLALAAAGCVAAAGARPS